MGSFDGITYGNDIWKTDPAAAFEEARSRIAMVLQDPERTSLFLSDLCALNALPDDLALCTHLKSLDIGDGYGPDKVHYWRRGHQPIENLQALSCLINLRALDVVNCVRFRIENVKRLTALQSLDCSGTEITSLAGIEACSSLQNLNCSGTKITSLAGIEACTALQFLDCTGTDIPSLAGIEACTALQSLDCTFTEITSLAGIKACTALQSLNCSDTKITSLAGIEACTALQFLDCQNIQITSLSGIEACNALLYLDCRDTQITSLAGIEACTALQSLTCSRTPITSLAGIEACIALQFLDCSETCLNGLNPLPSPRSLERLIAERVLVQGFPDDIFSTHFDDNCLPRVRAHLEDLSANPVPFNDVKLMVLGNGRIGKTQIVNRLRGRDYEEEADSTHGVVVASETIDGVQCAPTFNIWDFGGQDIYHGTHALFLKSRAIFLVVWAQDAEDDATHTHNGMTFRNRQLGWWLDFVRRFGSPTAPVIVAQNKMDLHGDQGEPEPVKQFRADGNDRGQLCKLLAYSAASKDGHGTLLDSLNQAVKQFNPPLIGQSRLAVIDALRELLAQDRERPRETRQHRLITHAHFCDICAEHGIKSDPSLFLEFLHNAGEVFWRKGLFDDQIILDQEWILDAIYTLLHRDNCVAQLREAEGRLTRRLLGLWHWDQEGYTEEEQDLFLDFMAQCGIVFPVSNTGETRYIAPDFLPDEPVNRTYYNFEPTDRIELCYASIPPTVIQAVISRIGELASADAVYRRHGVYFYEAETESNVLFEFSEDADWSGRIEIAACKGDAPQAIARVRKILREEEERLQIKPVSETDVDVKDNAPLAPGPDPNRPLEYYVSYAWDDPHTLPEDGHEAIVDDLCRQATERGITILRDKTVMTRGDRISEFIQRIGRSDNRVVVIISAKYLKSPYCMEELYLIWMRSRGEAEEFNRNVIGYVHEDVDISTSLTRASVARAWHDRYKEELELLEHMGTEDRANHHRIKQFSAHVADILHVVDDTIRPRSLDELLESCFD